MSECIINIDSDFFNAGVVIKDGVVTLAAPILKYMVGWNESRVIQYANTRGWGIGTILEKAEDAAPH